VYLNELSPFSLLHTGRMIMDNTKWAVVSILVLFSFACGLNQLLWYYTLSNAKRCTNAHYQSKECNYKFSRYFTG